MSSIWWEKTVEYKFILDNAHIFEVAAPLDGRHERWGDAVFKAANWLIIEFKRAEENLNSEIGKYDNYPAAEAALSGADFHHLLVYGAEDHGIFRLDALTYFSREFVEDPLSRGVDHETFTEYLAALYSYKTGEDTESGGGLSSVIGVTPDRGEVMTLSLDECFRLALDLAPPPPKNEISPPSYTPAKFRL